MRRAGPRPVGSALGALLDSLAPATLLAEVQRAWPGVAGPFAGSTRPHKESDGVIHVDCAAAVYAQELDLLSPRVVAALNEALGRPAVRGLRCGVRSAERLR